MKFSKQAVPQRVFLHNLSPGLVSRIRSQRGVVLPISLLALMMITLLGLALTTTSMISTRASTNDRQASDAFYLAESGIAHAKGLILNQGLDFDTYLQAGDTNGCTGDELSATPVFPFSAEDKITSIAAGGEAFGSGRYEVMVCDDDDDDNDPNDDNNDKILVVSTGYGADGASATLETVITNSPFPAIVSDGNLKIMGNPDILGTHGGIQANGNLEIGGNACAEQYFSSGGSITISGAPKTGELCAGSGSYDSPRDARPTEEPAEIPTLNPIDFKSEADYILGIDGSVKDDLGNTLKAPGSGKWGKWDWNGGDKEWKLTGDPVLSGTYYSEGSIAISGSPGSPGSPVSLTLIAEGWIDISGSPEMTPALTTGGVTYAAIAGSDLKISGNPSNGYQGVWYVKDQLAFSGNPTINGQIVCLNEEDVKFPDSNGRNLVELQNGVMVISGNFTITFDGGDALSYLDQSAWRECRGSNPATPCQ